MSKQNKTDLSRGETIVVALAFVAIVICGLVFASQKFDTNVYSINIQSIKSYSSGLGMDKETIVIQYTAKDLLGRNVHTMTQQSTASDLVEYPEAINKDDIADDEVRVSIYRITQTIDLAQEMKITVGKTDNIVTFETTNFKLRTKLVRNLETGEWEIKK